MTHFFTFALLLCTGISSFTREELSIASAADLQSVMNEIATRFQKQSGSSVRVTFGSSGNFFAQIQNGAPFDLFFSADVEYPKKLQVAGLVEEGSLYQYATGAIVLWALKRSEVELSKGLNVIEDAKVKRLAIANPAHAPYGRAAEAALKNAGLWQSASSKLVLGENISQAAQFVQSGNADAGILALSLALTPAMKERGNYFEIPRQLYPPLQQGVVILSHSAHKQLAAQFIAFLKSAEVKSLLKQHGFVTPEDAR